MRHAFLFSIEIPENRENAFKLFRNIDYGFESCIKQFLYFKMKIKRFLSVFIWMCVYLGRYLINIIYFYL